jgi:hypothetical protein
MLIGFWSNNACEWFHCIEAYRRLLHIKNFIKSNALSRCETAALKKISVGAMQHSAYMIVEYCVFILHTPYVPGKDDSRQYFRIFNGRKAKKVLRLRGILVFLSLG